MAQPTTTSLGLPLGTRPNIDKQTPLLTGTLRLYAVGDSITVGGTNESNGNTGRAWRQYVGEMLADSGVAYTAVGNLSSLATTWGNHRAITGQTINTFVTVDFADPATYLNTADPDIILLCTVGYNDINGGASGATTLTRWTALLELFRAFTNGRGVTPRIVASYLFRGATANDAAIAAFNAGLAAAVAAQQALGQKIVLVDPRPWIDGIAAAPPFRADGLHPKDNGAQLYADCIFPGLLNTIGMDAEWGRHVPPVPNALWSNLDMNDVWFHATDPFETATQATTGSSVDVNNDTEWNAAIGDDVEMVVKTGATLSARVWNSYDNLRIVIEDGATIGDGTSALRCFGGSNITITGPVDGTTGTGLIDGAIQLGGSESFPTVPDNVTIKYLCHTNGALGSEYGIPDRIAYVGMRSKNVYFNYTFTNLLVAGSNIYNAASPFWAVRAEGVFAKYIFVDSFIENVQNACIRLGPNDTGQPAPGPFLALRCTGVNSDQADAGAEGGVFRCLPSSGGTVPVTEARLVQCRFHANADTGDGAEIHPTDGYMDDFTMQDCEVITDGDWEPPTYSTTDATFTNVTILPKAGNAIPAYSSRNSAGSPRTL